MNRSATAAVSLSSKNAYVKTNGHLITKGVNSDTVSEHDKTVAVVTGFSENHFTESVDMIASIQRYSPTSPIIVYDLGISDSSRKTLQSFCHVKIRTFPFDKYPSHVRNLEACAWKPIIVQEVLQEFSKVLYGDASIRLMQEIGNLLQLLETASPIIGQSTAPSGPAGSYTHDGTLQYFNISRDKYKDVDMFAATYILIKRNPIIEETIIPQWVSCAMDVGCISPSGAKKWPCLTRLQENDHNAFIGCHRYDQSALSIVLFKTFGRSSYNKCIQDSIAPSIVKIARYKTMFNKVSVCQT